MIQVFAITLLLITLLTSAYGEVFVASKQGGHERYDICHIADNYGSLTITDRAGHLVEKTAINTDELNIRVLAPNALAAAKPPVYRFLNQQTDYKVINSNSQLEAFFAVGAITIENPSSEATTLVATIDQLCDNVLQSIRILGEFQIDLKIGDRVFADQLIIKRLDSGNIRARYIVPNSFESKVYKIAYDGEKLSFVIRVQERGEDYEAIFEARIDEKGILTGDAYILPERQHLGSFTSKRL